MAPGSPPKHQTGDPNPQDPSPPQNAGGQPPLPPPPGHPQFQPQPQQVQRFNGAPYSQQPLQQQQTHGFPEAMGQTPLHPLQGQGLTQYIYQQPKPNGGGTPVPNYQQPQQQSTYVDSTPAPAPVPAHPLSVQGQQIQYINGQPQNYQQQICFQVPQPTGYSNQQVPVQYVVQQQPVFPGQFVGTQPWSSDLFDCMNDSNSALITWCLPCVTVGQIAEILDNGSTTCATAGMIYAAIACFTGLPYLYSCGYRTKLRMRFNLVESPAPDMIIHCLCGCCAISQEYRELVSRGLDPTLGWNGVVAAQQMQQQGVVGMAPPKAQTMMN